MAQASDFLVEVRDVNFTRLGQIDAVYLNLKFVEAFRSVGSWELKLPEGHPLLAALKTKGAGIIVTDRITGRVYSGRVQTCTLSQDASDPEGTWLIGGVDDNVVAAATVVLPAPADPPDAQSAAYYTLAGNGETVMKDLVRRNAGDLATTARKYTWLTSAANLGRGALTSCSLRFDVLADALTDLGIKSGLGWRFYQAGAGVTFDVYEPQDKTDLIRLDIRNGGLESSELGWTAASATTVYVLGQGEGELRTVLPVTSAASLAEAAAYGLNWETAKDQRNTDDPDELLQEGEAVLEERGSTVYNLRVTPSDAPNQRLGEDWWLGDLVTIVVAGQATQATVTQVATSITAAGVIRQATVGDPVGFDWEAKVGAKLQDHEQRVSNLETTVDAGVTWESISGKPGVFDPGDVKLTARATAPTGWLLCDGAAVSRTTYAALFAAIGTAYGAGDGSTTFNLPNLKGRVPVGHDSGQTEFDTLGETGGAKVHHHDLSDLGQAQVAVSAVAGAAVRSRTVASASWTATRETTDATGAASSTVGTFGAALMGQTNDGSGLPPYLVLNYIIKT